MKLQCLILLAIPFAVLAAPAAPAAPAAVEPNKKEGEGEVKTQKGPISPHFQAWLSANGYSDYAFARSDLGSFGSFGGRSGDESTGPSGRDPVIFIHGNSDQALRNPSAMNTALLAGRSGWDDHIEHFKSKGHTDGDLFATTWGPANLALASVQTHSCEYLMHVRKFTDAVLAYTGASKVDMISHSMGVTIARRIILGGHHTDEKGVSCDLGPSLSDKVDTFLGIAGGNYGLCSCQYMTMLGGCNKKTGFYPGKCGLNFLCGMPLLPCTQSGMSQFLTHLNSNPGFEGSHRFAFWSNTDEALGYNGNCWGKPTARLPGQTGQKVLNLLTHMQSKADTKDAQYEAIVNHVV